MKAMYVTKIEVCLSSDHEVTHTVFIKFALPTYAILNPRFAKESHTKFVVIIYKAMCQLVAVYYLTMKNADAVSGSFLEIAGIGWCKEVATTGRMYCWWFDR